MHPSVVRPIAPDAHSPSSVQAPGAHAQVSPHRSVVVPHIPHAAERLLPGTHSPLSPSHAPASQTRAEVQKRVRVPHIPQLTISVRPGVSHAPPVPESPREPASERAASASPRGGSEGQPISEPQSTRVTPSAVALLTKKAR